MEKKVSKPSQNINQEVSGAVVIYNTTDIGLISSFYGVHSN